MQQITVRKHITDTQASELAGRMLTESDYDLVVNDDCIVYKENGDPLLIYCKGVLSARACSSAYQSLRQAALEGEASNRGAAAGKFRVIGDISKIGVVSDMRLRPIKKDGTVSSTNYSLSSDTAIKKIKAAGARVEQQLANGNWVEFDPRSVSAGVAGYLDRNQRFPYCRLTAFNVNHPERFAKAMPLIRQVARVFAEKAPDRYRAQMDVVERTVDDYVISGTPFTTITINMNFQTAVHKDAGKDYFLLE